MRVKGLEKWGDSIKSCEFSNGNTKYNRNKVKYTCPDCGAKVWGKPELHIECSDCACSFEEEEHENTDEN